MQAREFAEAFLGRLARNDFHNVGAIDQYLALPEASRSGDEANIVDNRVTRALLEALGYATAEIDYNAAKNGLRPDFVLRIKDYLGCCFVVEDKATPERLGPHRSQLASYMTANRCPRGLLINGERILGFDDAGAASVASLDFGIGTAVRLWRGADLFSAGRTGWEALPRSDQDILAVIARRYGRDAFQGVTTLIDDLTLDKAGNPHAADGSSWVPDRTRLFLISAKIAPDALVEAVQELIGELCEDVAVQFAVHKQDYEDFQREIERAPGSTAPAEDLMNEIADRLLVVLPSDRRDGMRTRLRQTMRGERPEAEIDEVVSEVRAAAGGQGNGRTADALGRAGKDAKALARRYGRHLVRARERHAASIMAVEAHERWRAAVGTLLLSGASSEKAQSEYFTQTAYLVIVRMLVVRVLEDKGLTPRVFTNGGAALWFRQVEPHYFSLAIGRSAARLLQIAYENAQATYAHFYDDHRVFDWYVPDRIMVVRVLHRLAGFDLAEIDRDIIGTVYGRFVNDRHKHEQGMYYTPTSVVSFILDRVGWNGAESVGAKLLDPACGSGAFLVEAARRAIEAHRAQARHEGHKEIPPERVQAVLDSLRDGLVGFDLNPFACALAEINLLVQVLDVVAHALGNGHPARLDRFRIFNTDALRLEPGARAVLEEGLDRSEAADLPDEEQAKARLGMFADGFDMIVGNPPYVRADEGATGLLDYRRQVEGHPIPPVSNVLTQKWDLFIPFVALGQHLLRSPGGKLGMIVSNALETVLYARALREQLAAGAKLREVHFFEPGVKLFEDAAVRNTILILETGEPDEASETLREWHGGPPAAPSRRQSLPQIAYGAEVFRPALPSFRVPPAARAEPLNHICYVSKGMVLSADEKADGGQHRGSFKLGDLLVDYPDAIHSKPYIGSRDLRIANSPVGDFLFAAARIRFLEYNTSRIPALISRPTFEELYDREKIMVGEFGGSIHDDGTLNPLGFLACNHSVFLFMPWRLLVGINNRSLADRLRELPRPRADLEQISRDYPLPFLCGLFNSTVWDSLMTGRATTSIAGRAQPDNYAEQSIPVPDPVVAAAVGQAADAARLEGQALSALLAAGWRRLEEGWRSPPTLLPQIQDSEFGVARTRWALTIERPTAKCGTLRREGPVFLSGQRVAARLPDSIDEASADFLLRILNAQNGATLETIEASGLRIPLRPEDAATAEAGLIQAERGAMSRELAILALRAKIDDLVAPLFEAVHHPPIISLQPG